MHMQSRPRQPSTITLSNSLDDHVLKMIQTVKRIRARYNLVKQKSEWSQTWKRERRIAKVLTLRWLHPKCNTQGRMKIGAAAVVTKSKLTDVKHSHNSYICLSGDPWPLNFRAGYFYYWSMVSHRHWRYCWGLQYAEHGNIRCQGDSSHSLGHWGPQGLGVRYWMWYL